MEGARTGATRVLERIDELAAISEDADRLTRRFATPALRRASDRVATWLEAAGLAVRYDAVGNLVGRYEGARPGARALVLGSHLDTVRDAGRFDGALGVLCGLAAVELLAARGERLPFAVEVVAFADEEGLRYGTAYLGSAAFTGTLEPRTLELVDEDGVSVASALRAAGGDPDAVESCARARGELLGYCEVHIEQGPALELAGLPVGVVSAIAGQSRARATLTGQAAHAGTTAMAARRDALAGAAELVLAVERIGRAEEGLVATVGRLDVVPGAGNVVPGGAVASVDVRHRLDGLRGRALTAIEDAARQIAAARELRLDWEVLQETTAVTMSPHLTGELAATVREIGLDVRELASGAGHDAAVLAGLAPACMLFVRCRGGVSHHPDEHVDAEDVAAALAVLDRFLRRLAASGESAGFS